MNDPDPMLDRGPNRGPDGGAPTWLVGLIVFGLMGIGGPLLALVLFFVLRRLV